MFSSIYYCELVKRADKETESGDGGWMGVGLVSYQLIWLEDFLRL